MALVKVLGDWLDGSGWVSVMMTAKVTTDGKGDDLKKGSFAARSQWVATLFCLCYQTYNS